MSYLALPLPPNPDDRQYRSNPLAYNRALYTWALQMKGKIETTHQLESKAVGPFSVSTYTTTTAVTGATTGTDLSNAFCTLVNILTTKGVISPTTPV